MLTSICLHTRLNTYKYVIQLAACHTYNSVLDPGRSWRSTRLKAEHRGGLPPGRHLVCSQCVALASKAAFHLNVFMG